MRMARDMVGRQSMQIEPRSFLPVEVVFHPSWWHRHYGITFDEGFFFDPERRVADERRMRTALNARFGDLGLGEKDASPRPVIGPVHLAAGFLPSAVLGCEIRYAPSASPEVLPRNLTEEQTRALDVPDLDRNPAFQRLIVLMNALEARYGTLEGDVNWEGVQNVALNLRGQQLLLDYYENPKLVRRLLDVVERTLEAMASYIRQRTGTSSVAVNRIVGAVDPRISLHSNCTVAMISPETYEKFLLPHDQHLAQRLWPYGIHHCGDDMHKVRREYAKVDGAELFDVGWGSDVAVCRAALPKAVFSLRLSPIRVSQLSPADVAADVERLLLTAGPLERAAVCSINMDDQTPDANVRAIFEIAEHYRRCGA
jgi:uroporphyrinogen-III decarboxylase